MQSINIEYEDARGESIEKVPANFADVFNAVPSNSWKQLEAKYPWTFTIDPYGNTTFNILQWPHLINEFTALQDEILDDKAKNILKGLVQFLKKIETENHTFLKFYGD